MHSSWQEGSASTGSRSAPTPKSVAPWSGGADGPLWNECPNAGRRRPSWNEVRHGPRIDDNDLPASEHGADTAPVQAAAAVVAGFALRAVAARGRREVNVTPPSASSRRGSFACAAALRTSRPPGRTVAFVGRKRSCGLMGRDGHGRTVLEWVIAMDLRNNKDEPRRPSPARRRGGRRRAAV